MTFNSTISQRALSTILAVLLAVAMTSLVLPTHTASASVRTAHRNAKSIARDLSLLGVRFERRYERGLLARGGQKVIYKTLRAGRRYALLAAGCDDAYDVDLALYAPDGRLVARDTTVARGAAVVVEPQVTVRVKLVVRLHNSTANGAHWVLITAYSDI